MDFDNLKAPQFVDFTALSMNDDNDEDSDYFGLYYRPLSFWVLGISSHRVI